MIPKQAVMITTAMADVTQIKATIYIVVLSSKETTNARMIRPCTAINTHILSVERDYCYACGVPNVM